MAKSSKKSAKTDSNSTSAPKKGKIKSTEIQDKQNKQEHNEQDKQNKKVNAQSLQQKSNQETTDGSNSDNTVELVIDDIKTLLTPIAIILGSIIISLSVSLSLIFGVGGVSGGVTGVANAGECSTDEPYSDACIYKFAETIDLNMSRFETCYENKNYDAEVTSDYQAGEQIGVQGTPSLFIGEKTGDSQMTGFQMGVGSVDTSVVANVVDQIGSGGIEAAQDFWLEEQLAGLDSYETQLRDFYANQGQSGDTLESSVESGLLQRESEIRSEVELQEIEFGDGILKGNENAQAVLMEFSDYECPFCKSFAAGIGQQIMTDLVDPGELLFIYRDFPLESIHPKARDLAIAARCAGDQDKYFEMHDAIFDII